MEQSQAIHISPLVPEETLRLLNIPTKKFVILLRWPVVIICSYLLLPAAGTSFEPTLVHAFIPLYLLSNVALNYVDHRRFESPYFYMPLVLSDIFFLTASLILSGQTSTDFYLAYFLIIMLAVLTQDFRGSVAIATTATFIYAYFLFRSTPAVDSGVFLRLPFLFLVALFCGYFAQLVRREKILSMAKIDQLKSELLSVVSHELRTPLNVVIGTAWVLQEKKLGHLNVEQEKAVENIMKNSKELLDVLNTVLEASRIGTGIISVDIEEIDLGILLGELKIFYVMAPARGPALTWNYPSNLPAIKTDKAKLKIILQNLINNGVKFTKEGNVTVSARDLPREERVEFKITDTGIGISEESLPGIFEMFYQADSSTTRSHGGLGMGLYIVKTFTDLLGGTITVESRPSKGSAFCFTLPYAYSR